MRESDSEAMPNLKFIHKNKKVDIGFLITGWYHKPLVQVRTVLSLARFGAYCIRIDRRH